MNKKSIGKHLIYLISANIISVVISGITLLIFPKFFSISDFGLWQFYMLLNMYFSYATFGLADGVYVRYSENQNLNKIKFIGAHFWSVLLLDFILIISLIIITDNYKMHILLLASLSCILVAPKAVIVYHLQSIGKTIETSLYIIIEKTLFIVLIIALYIILNNISLINIIYIDLLSKAVPLIILVLLNTDKFTLKSKYMLSSLSEIFKSFTVGIPLLLINASTLFIIGIFRLSIEKKWGIESFSKASIMINFSSFLMIFITSISLIMFPLLRNTKKDNYPYIYNKINKIVFFMLLLVMFIYYPIEVFVKYYLPEYTEGLIFFPILLVITIFDGKIIILNSNLLKILRKEKKIFVYNVLLIFITLSLYIVIIYFVKEILFVFILMLLVIFMKYLLLEYEVQKSLMLKNMLRNLLLNELIYLILILTIMYYIKNIYISMVLFVITLLSYTLVNKDSLKEIHYLKKSK